MEKFFEAFEKKAETASHLAELAGLGIIAAPSIQHLRGKPMSESKAHKYEIAGLGTLAAPSVYHLGKKFVSKGKA